MITVKNIAITLCLMMCTTISNVIAKEINADNIYKFAQEKNVESLQHNNKYIDVENVDGDTAYCIALKQKEKDVAKFLEKAGANTNHKCVSTLISTNKTFLGMGKKGWAITGGALVAGGVAVAAGGGGGSDSSNNANLPSLSPSISCINGDIVNNKCICTEGWTGNTCEDKTICSYSTTSCSVGYEETGNTCKSGDATYKECRLKTVPSGYQATECGLGYNTVDTLLSGTTNYYKCEAKSIPDGYTATPCSGGYIQDGETFVSGTTNYYKCVAKTCGSEYKLTCSTNEYETSNTCISGEDTLKECKIHTTISNCEVYSTTSDICSICKTGYTGANCSQIADGYIEQNGQIYEKLNCVYGTQNANICECSSYATGTLCETLNTGYIDNGSGNISCDIANGYGKNGNGECVTKGEDIVGKTGKYNNDTINITNNKYNNVYGISNNSGNVYNLYEYTFSDSTISAILEIDNISDANIYGVYSSSEAILAYAEGSESAVVFADSELDIKNIGDGNVYGVYGETEGINVYGVSSYSEDVYVTSRLFIDNKGAGNVYGIYGKDFALNNNYVYSSEGETANNIGYIAIRNEGDGNVYGLYADKNSANGRTSNNQDKNAMGTIFIKNIGDGNVYGSYGKISYNGSYYVGEDSVIKILNIGDGTVYGMNADSIYNYGGGYIDIDNLGNGITYGLYGYNGTNKGKISITREGAIDNNETPSDDTDDIYYNIEDETKGSAYGAYITEHHYSSDDFDNDGTIIIKNINTSYGIYGVEGTNINNNGAITITGAETGYGIYHKGNGGSITNSGTIDVSATNAYGIFVEDGTDTTVTNTGTIKLNGVECNGDCSGDTTNGNYIVLNGATLLNSGTMSARSLNLNNMGGEVVATSTSSFVAKDDISGNLSISNNVVKNGFDTTYTIKDMINAADTSNLNLVSKSAMFDANLKNGTDAVMTMKSFNDVLKNKSLANFLQKNYNLQNNEGLFGSIKTAENIKSLNNFADEMFGKNMFSRFAFEDLMIMRELNFDINNKLFSNKEDSISIGGNTSSFAFSGNSRYSLTSVQNGNNSMGISVAISDINSDDGHDDNQRYDRMYNLSMPMGYQTNGLKFISTPRVGYSYGTYDRDGFNNQTYEGTVEKQMFAFMNEARYPLQIGGWNIAPSAELNFINYHISGHEKDKEYSLKIKSQNNYSVEAGVGLYASKETKFSKDSSLRFNGGVAVYHEFADPYKMKLGMQGMSGTFTLRDEKRSDNRAVVQSQIEFKHNNMSLSGNVISYIDHEYETNATLDFKFEF